MKQSRSDDLKCSITRELARVEREHASSVDMDSIDSRQAIDSSGGGRAQNNVARESGGGGYLPSRSAPGAAAGAGAGAAGGISADMSSPPDPDPDPSISIGSCGLERC